MGWGEGGRSCRSSSSGSSGWAGGFGGVAAFSFAWGAGRGQKVLGIRLGRFRLGSGLLLRGWGGLRPLDGGRLPGGPGRRALRWRPLGRGLLGRRLLGGGCGRGRGGLRLPAGLLLHGLHQPLLPARAVLRQDLLQGEALVRHRDIRPAGQAVISIFFILGSHAAPFLSIVPRSRCLFSPGAGAPPRTAGSPPRRRRSGSSAFPAWGCSPKSRSSRRPGGSCRPPRCR